MQSYGMSSQKQNTEIIIQLDLFPHKHVWDGIAVLVDAAAWDVLGNNSLKSSCYERKESFQVVGMKKSHTGWGLEGDPKVQSDER